MYGRCLILLNFTMSHWLCKENQFSVFCIYELEKHRSISPLTCRIEKGSRFDQQGAIEGYIWERVEVFACWPQFKRRLWKDNKVNRKWWMLVATLTITGSFSKVPSQQNLFISLTGELNPSSFIKSHDHVPLNMSYFVKWRMNFSRSLMNVKQLL